MAIVNDPFFEKLSGRLGDYVFKQMNGKTFVYYRPKSQKKTNYAEKPKDSSRFYLSSLFKRK